MMRMRTKNEALPPDFDGGRGLGKEWELRPGGMLVQKRTDGGENRVPLPPPIRVRVKYGSVSHEIRISSQATFGELKKMLSGPTGLHHQDQKLFYKDKERNSTAYLDSAGVKDKSKMVLEEDAISREKRFIEMRKNAKMEKAAKLLSVIGSEVDRLAKKVSALETVCLLSKLFFVSIVWIGGGICSRKCDSERWEEVLEKDIVNLVVLLTNRLFHSVIVIHLAIESSVWIGQVSALETVVSKGGKVVEKDILNLIELLMNQLLKLDGVVDDGDVKSQRKIQVRSIQKHVEKLDLIKLKNSSLQQHTHSNGDVSSPPSHQPRHSLGESLIDCDSPQQQGEHRHSGSGGGSVVITTQWETFDSTSNPFLGYPSTSDTTEKNSIRPAQPGFTWNLL
ncbi:hypothetical protein SASPL_119164 [Salvia splendens]|uniref:BAG family molecular chaperone regulator 1 n=1 Tax=Salvia splendens TaxID=180675 RepID=A0A8X8XY29_SALSN|nr:hypothetical protein SASPL_119164 [Salvia splendens]